MEEHNPGKRVRIMAWFVPRSVSTALTKCLSVIDGMEVWFEPFFYCHHSRERYHSVTDGDHLPTTYEGNEDKALVAAEAVSFYLHGIKIKPEQIIYGNIKHQLDSTNSRYVFVKDMPQAMQSKECRRYMPSGFRHVFLIRRPTHVFSSLRKAYLQHMRSQGFLQGDQDEKTFDYERDNILFKANELYSSLHDLWKYVRENHDPNPIVLNMDDMLADPGLVLPKFCQVVGLPYSDSLLQWDESTERLKSWKTVSDDLLFTCTSYLDKAVKSREFHPPTESMPDDQQPPDVQRLAAAALPYFHEMNKYKI